jgi:hypothetical protein
MQWYGDGRSGQRSDGCWRAEDKGERGQVAVETWWKKEKRIVVTKGVKVLPNFATEVSQ